MLRTAFAAGILLQLTAALPSSPSALEPRQKAAGACVDYHIFLTRGAGDPYPGTSGPLPALVCKGLTSCDYEDVIYTGTFDKVCASVEVGVANQISQVKSYATKCPKAKLVMVGHSEGSAVTGNVLGGGTTSFPGCTLKSTTANGPDTAGFNQIVAVALTGDMRHTAGQAYNTGSGKDKNGLWARSAAELSSLSPWNSKIRSWCDQADPVCAGGSDVSAHGGYMNKVGQEMADWIRGQLGVKT